MLSDKRIREIYSMDLLERLELPVFDVRKFKEKRVEPVNCRFILYPNGPKIGVIEFDDCSTTFGRTEKLGKDCSVEKYTTLPHPIKFGDSVIVTFYVDSRENIFYKEDYTTGEEIFDTFKGLLDELEEG